jgi:tetratricopeptide (TPR) repeat protein
MILCSLFLAASAAADETGDGAEQFQQSYEHEGAGKLKEALADLDGVPASRKDAYLTLARRGWLLYRLGVYDQSVESYQKAIEVLPKSVEPRLGILLPLQALRRWSEAEKTAKEVLRIDPNNYLAVLRLAYSVFNLHHYPMSTALYQKLKELYPSDVEVRSGLGWSLLKQGKSAEAAREFRELLSISPRHALAREGLQAATAAH